MSTARILIVYATRYGHTAKVARRVGDALAAAGLGVTLANAEELPRGLSPRAFDGVVIASSVMYGRHRPTALRFVRTHRDALNARPTAFVSVSGSAASALPAERAKARACVDEFLRETGWRPTATELVAGATSYTQYSPLLRWIMRNMARKEGRPTDTARDHELTDWAQLRRFAESFAATVGGGAVAAPAAAPAAAPVVAPAPIPG